MPVRRLPGPARSIVFAAAMAVALFKPAGAASAEVRALWVVRTALTSPAAVEAMVGSAAASGFNTLVVQVRGRGDAYYAGGDEPRAPALDPAAADFDPLAMTIARAHQAGLRVHAWMNVNLIASAAMLPASRDHVIYQHPEWLMVPRVLASDLWAMEPRRPEYLERLAGYVRSRPEAIEGLYLSPIAEGSVEYTLGVVRDIVRRYAVDGVHLDYVRYPSDEFDYSREALLAFRRDLAIDLSRADLRNHDARLAQSPAAYAEAFPERWRGFRMSRLSDLVARLRATIKAARPGAIVSAAVVPDSVDAARHRLQNWRDWLTRGLLDVVCPMAYTTDAGLFTTQIAAARELAGAHGLWAGIGAYRMPSAQIVEAVRNARRQRADGVILFSYDSLVDPARGGDGLAQVGRAAFGER
ncbi:MAG: family 10 glycosylhydrolase [Acidobacteria bacterium]|nr:family 10 glycosylhydrolase [Acidobacteriota bacterium]